MKTPGLQLKVPPLLIAAIVAAAMWLTTRWLPRASVTIPAKPIFAAAFAVFGILICAAGILSFKRARTTVNPMRPDTASSLVDSGIYRFTRNPMYLGGLLVLTAYGIHLSNLLAFAGLPAFILYMNQFQIRPEEQALSARFGPAYDDYRARVRRWL